MFKTLLSFWMKDKNTTKWLMALPCLFSSPIFPSEIEALTDDVHGSFWDYSQNWKVNFFFSMSSLLSD